MEGSIEREVKLRMASCLLGWILLEAAPETRITVQVGTLEGRSSTN